MTSLSSVALQTPDGEVVRLGDLVDRPTVIDIVRYYGCAPCRAQLHALASHHDGIRAEGGAVLAVGPRAAYQARLLQQRRGIPFPLLLDQDHNLTRALGMHRQSLLRFIFDVRAWWRWLRAFLRHGQGVITGGWWEVPAIVVVDAEAQVAWKHLGRSIGDYPPLEETLAALDRALGKA